MNLQKIEVDSMRKNLAALNAKPFLNDAERQLVDTLTKRLADGESLAVMEKALKGPKFRLNSI